MENQLTAQLKQAANGFLEALSGFSDDEFSTIPFEGSWTPGQVAQHILLSVDGMLSLITGSTQSTDRDWKQNAAQISSVFLNFDIKLHGPDFVQPDAKPKNKAAIIFALRKTFDGLIMIAENEDLTQICTQSEFPTMGYLTRFEILTFVDVHTRRHTHQLQKIAPHFA